MISDEVRDQQRRNGPPLIGRSPPFIFVHIPKAAGSSIHAAFGPYARERNPLRRFLAKFKVQRTPDGLRADGLHAHSKARDYKAVMGSRFKAHFVFTFVRNPFDLHVSNFHFIRQSPDHPRHAEFSDMRFEDYVAFTCAQKRLQSEYILDGSGKSLVDYIGRVETMEESLAELNQKLGTTAQVTHRNRSDHSSTASYFTPRAVQMIADTFAQDFELLGYDKTGPVTSPA